jgi:hypothetical protein
MAELYPVVTLPARKARRMTCPRDFYTWDSVAALSRVFVHCPKCGTSVTVNPVRARSASTKK